MKIVCIESCEGNLIADRPIKIVLLFTVRESCRFGDARCQVQISHSNFQCWTAPMFLSDLYLCNDDKTLVIPNQDICIKEIKKDSMNITNNDFFTLTIFSQTSMRDHIFSLSNSFIKLIRIINFAFRFKFNFCNPNEKRSGSLNVSELKEDVLFLILSAQRDTFVEEFKCLEKGTPVQRKSKLSLNIQLLNVQLLNVFLRVYNIIRVGGRISHADLPLNSKFLIMLPDNNKLTGIILKYFDLKYFYLIPQALLSHVKQKFWPLSGRNFCRRTGHKYINCFKNKPVVSCQLMTDLPRQRVIPNLAFCVLGLDYCGPFFCCC